MNSTFLKSFFISPRVPRARCVSVNRLCVIFAALREYIRGIRAIRWNLYWLLLRVVAAIRGGHCKPYRFLNERLDASLHERHEYHDSSCGKYRVIGLLISYPSCPSCYNRVLNHRVIGLSISPYSFSRQAAEDAWEKQMLLCQVRKESKTD